MDAKRAVQETLAEAEADGDTRNLRLLCVLIFCTFGGGVFTLVAYALFNGMNVWVMFGASMGGLVLLSAALFACYFYFTPIWFKTVLFGTSVAGWIGFMVPIITIVSGQSNKIPN